MFTFIVGIIIFVAVLLVLVVLAQNSKGGGLTNQFGGSGASNIIGVKKTGDLLEKLTWGFVITIMVLALSTNLITQNTRSSNEVLERAGDAPAAPSPDLNSGATEQPAATDTAK